MFFNFFNVIHQDCARARVIVSRLVAPAWCAASLVIDRAALEAGGAQALRFRGEAIEAVGARAAGEDRPWSPRPPPRKAAPPRAAPKPVLEDSERDDALDVLGEGSR